MHLKIRPGVLFLIPTFFLIGVSGDKPQLEWISPSVGDAFRPGDDVVGKWKADKAVVSPSFKLCLGSSQSSVNRRTEDTLNGNCGAKFYPTVQQDSGMYSISVAVPNSTTTVETCYLLMEDDFGNVYRSPPFSIPNDSEGTTESVSPPVSDAQSPIEISKSSAPMVTVTAISVIAPDTNPPPASSTNLYATRKSVPIAAFAVPLSIIGVILLVAGGLCFRNNNKIKEERARDVEKLNLERKESGRSLDSFSSRKSGYSRQSDIEHALNVLSKHSNVFSSHHDTPVPLFMPADVPNLPTYLPKRNKELRRSTKEPYLISRADTYTQYQYRTRSQKCASRYNEKPSNRMLMPVSSHRPSSSYEPSLTLCSSSRAPSITNLSRPHSRATVHSHERDRDHAPSPTAGYSESRGPSQPDSRASKNTESRPYLPPIYTLYSHREEHRDGEGHVTESILDDYLLPSPYDPPPACLMPAPQRLHVKNARADAPAREEYEEKMTEDLGLYDIVANNLRRGHESGH